MTTDKTNSSSESVASDTPVSPKKLTAFQWVLLSAFFGIFTGLFFGEYCSPFEYVGTIFIGLLQMTIYPYIAISILANVGKLTLGQASRLARRGLIILGLLWLIGLFMLIALPMSFPDWTTAAFFSQSRLSSSPETNYFDLFIPSNPFASFAQGHVPAIVVFCICIGIALIKIENKKPFFKQLDLLSRALAQVNGFVLQWMPIGIFALTAHAAGTLSIEEFARLQGYLLVYTVGVLFLSFWVLPMLITTVTPFTYRQVMQASRDAVITGFVTGKLIVVLPLLIDGTRKLFRSHIEKDEAIDSDIGLMYPLAYPFPNLGKILTALFIPFSAWFLGEEIPWGSYPGFLGASLATMFANVILAIESLLHMMHLPTDMLHLFMVGGVYSSRIGEVLGVVHLMTFVTLVTSYEVGILKIQWRKFLLYFVFTGLLLVVMIQGIRLLLSQSVKDAYTKDKVLLKMQLLEKSADIHVLPKTEANPVPLRPGQSYLQRIRERGWIRVGFNPNNLPYSFFNATEDLVGFDIEMAHLLASSLQVKLEFVPFDPEKLQDQMKQDCFDLVMSGIPGTLDRAEHYLFSDPYLDVNLGLVVADHRLNDFQTENNFHRLANIRIAHREALTNRFRQRLSRQLVNPTFIKIRSYESFFNQKDQEYDALLMDAESGSAWTILYPHYRVAVPKQLSSGFPLVYLIGGRDQQLKEVINTFIRLNQDNGSFRRAYDHWILGKVAEKKSRRWCIIRDVLHWVE